jgi:aryl-alcohol dehydrogenase-like predicted oxidoreductase
MSDSQAVNGMTSFEETTFGSTEMRVHRLGLSASYFPGRKTIHYALDHGVNLFFAYGWDMQMVRTLRDVFQHHRNDIVLATGAYNLIWGHPNLRRTLEKRLRQFRTDHIDVFLFLGVLKPEQMSDSVMEDLCRFREEGKVRAVGLSTHNRKFAGQLAAGGRLNSLMVRYNAAHRGAEQDIFPHLHAHDPGLISYTATRWRYLLRRPKGWPADRKIPRAGDCYRFVLSNPHVHVCLTAPQNIRQLKENLEALREGPLDDGEMQFMKEFGDVVHMRKKYFM